MQNKVLYSVTGIFQTPDSIKHAAKSIADAGYKRYDINTPYPVHGIPKAMGMTISKLGYFTLVFGLSGIALALGFTWIITNIIYPLVQGGKPFFALPPFIPITFEVTVLLSSCGTVIIMLLLYFKFPNNSHPLHDTNYMKKVSSDKYGAYIMADDPNFDQSKVRSLLESLGAIDIEDIYYDEETVSLRPKVFEPKFLGFLLVAILITAGATYFTLNKLLFMPPFDWMSFQSRVNAQSLSTFFPDKHGMRMPPSGTIARGFMPFPYEGDPDKAGKMLVNPMTNTQENIEQGRKQYDIFCSPCHDWHGTGNSRLRGQFPNPPSLHSQKVRNWSDGMIYYIITMGQNTMPSYAYQVSREDRWAIILYVRTLQRAMNAKPEDIK
ncbi:MAG: hypothetical protein HW421_307 [Ignavibacteria bacterium]|nr:hypothetical protein [Ignavibacteria bacterium]